MSTKEHYENHLARYYSWMLGDFDSRMNETKAFFQTHNITPTSTKVALDLGAGSGLQSLPLAQLGFEVTAIDFSATLLKELRQRANGLAIETIESDLLHFENYAHFAPELIVCMGDTLTHLDSIEVVRQLLQQSAKQLVKNGKLILTFRDLSNELQNELRFIPVKSDENKIFTCFLEYHTDFVKVFDIVHEKENGMWKQNISFYNKLKLSRALIEDLLQSIGLQIAFSDTTRGLVTIISTKEL